MASSFSSEKSAPSSEAHKAGAVAAKARVIRSAEELESALLSIRQARDTVIARNLELSSELALARDRVSELDYERDAADRARDAALQLTQELSQQNDELRERELARADDSAALQAAVREAVQTACDEHAEATAPNGNDAAEIDRLRREIAEIEALNGLTKSQHAKHVATLGEQLASAQRARDIAVGAVTNAQRQVERLAAERRVLQAEIAAEKATFAARLAQLESQTQMPAACASEPAEAALDPAAGVITGDGVASLCACIESLCAEPSNRAILEELDERFHGCAASASGLGHGGIARFSSTCGELTRWLRKMPRKVEAALPTLREAVDLLAALSADAHPERIADPAGALVYSVDDDPDNCDCIAMSLEKLTLKTRYAMKPEIALTELMQFNAELIILDVDLPGMDGFELSERIRATPNHGSTPIIFLSGMMSTRDRLDSLSGGLRVFIPKPYNLNELNVVVLGMILKSRFVPQESGVTLRVV